jgi:ATP-dependent helicase/nuclease subunit A
VSMVPDSPARIAAVDPSGSFCVTAPAGSGKTELLIQRYLCLLSRVSRPEQVLAITFTRKAAAEMRERVLQALQAAVAGESCRSTHQQATRSFALQVLEAGERGGWQLLRDVSRFNIKTIDSFCAGLARQLPVLSQFGGQARTQDDVTALYAEAVVELYKLVEDSHPIAADVAALMLHFDNDWDRLQQLLVAMLARREQWRGFVGVHYSPADSAAHLLAAVDSLVSDSLAELVDVLTPYSAELLDLLQFSARNIAASVPERFPAAAPGELADWYQLRNLLLTRSGQWRKSITKSEGFPAGDGHAKQRKSEWQSLISQLQQVDGLEARLAAITSLPAFSADSSSWQLVLHLSRLLPMLAAQLLLVFRKHGVVDHSQVAQAALLALGEDDAPTELALRLDYQIEHILVDEFQDTAVTQYELLHKLTRGWGEHNAANPDTPRTLMLVGDGMQSVYGFRGANVGLFLKARREGFNGVRLRHLELLCNFRSDGAIVDWVNSTFGIAFPAQDDALRSRVRYRAATAVRQPSTGTAVELHGFTGDTARAAETAFICDEIVACLQQGTQTIAVLGRNRSHLQAVISELKQRGIAYSAPELDNLARSPIVADLLTLCRALANDADRLAWMALLRAPWCGLQLGDLMRIARHPDAAADTPLWSALESEELLRQLSLDGRNRVLHILPALRRARAKRDRLSLRVWIEQAWLGLGGPGCALHRDQLHDAETFLQLLETAEAEGVGLNLEWLSTRLQKSYLAGGDPDSRVQLLTLHKAKGLEYDRVILPQLDRIPRSDGREVLLWDEHSSSIGERVFLLAADDHSPPDAPTLYNYLRAQRRQKALLESTRLLYVGATRAIHKLLLTACVTPIDSTGEFREPSRQSLLNRIWPTFERQMCVHAGGRQRADGGEDRTPPALLRLSRESIAEAPAMSAPNPPARGTAPVTQARNRIERSVGTVVHLALEELCQRRTLPERITAGDEQRWRYALRRRGIWGPALDAAVRSVASSIWCCLQEQSRGRWVLSPDHLEARSEWALTTVNAQGLVEDLIIDRTFVDAATGIRWVIDYKNTRPASNESLEDFAGRQGELYLQQLQRYRNAVRELDHSPLRCGLFFTAIGHLYTLAELDLPARESLTP